MPQFNDYPEIDDLLAADLILVYKSDVGAVKTIAVDNLAAALRSITRKNLGITNINSATTLDSTNELVIGNSGAGFTVTLPLSASNAGLPLYLSNIGAGDMTVNTVGGDTIRGLTEVTLSQYESFLFVADGDAMWLVFGITT